MPQRAEAVSSVTAPARPIVVPPHRFDTNVLGRRIVAILVDTVLVLVALGLFVYLALGRDQQSVSTALTGSSAGLATLFYMVSFESRWGATPGKLLAGVRVVDFEGRVPSSGQVLGRNFARIIDNLLFVGFFVALFNGRRQRLGDQLARTLVVRARS